VPVPEGDRLTPRMKAALEQVEERSRGRAEDARYMRMENGGW